MNITYKRNAISARIKQAIEGHVTLAAYSTYEITRPYIEPWVARPHMLTITGPYRWADATVFILGAYERK